MSICRFVKLSSFVCVALCAIISYFYLPAIVGLFYTKWDVRHRPELWIVPTPLTDLSVARSIGQKFSYFGYEFESPWTEVKRERKYESIVVLNFMNGGVISLTNPAESLDALQLMQQEARKRGRNISDVFGDSATRSNYALQSKTLQLTPADLRPFSSRQEMAGNSVLLIIKGIRVTNRTDAIYSFQTDWLHGFQIDSHNMAGRKEINIYAFDAGDHEMDVMVGSEPRTAQPSQEDVNRILYTLRPIKSVSPANEASENK